MSWSDPRPEQAFVAGLGLPSLDPPSEPGAPNVSAAGIFAAPAGAGVVTPVSFVPTVDAADEPDGPGVIRPAVFTQFGMPTPAELAAIAAAEAEAAAAAEAEAAAAAAALPPPPDYEAIKAAAWSEGFQQGYDEGLRLAAEEQRETAERLGALLLGIAGETEAFVRGLEDDVVELALAVAEKVIAREVTVDREVVIGVVRAALAEVHDATELRIRVNPDDLPLLEERWQQMLPRSVAQQSELRPDDLVERGGVVVETRIGYVDGQLKTRLNQVVNTFQAVLDGEPI